MTTCNSLFSPISLIPHDLPHFTTFYYFTFYYFFRPREQKPQNPIIPRLVSSPHDPHLTQSLQWTTPSGANLISVRISIASCPNFPLFNPSTINFKMGSLSISDIIIPSSLSIFLIFSYFLLLF